MGSSISLLRGYSDKFIRLFEMECNQFKEARNSFFGLGVYLLKSNFHIEDKLRFP